MKVIVTYWIDEVGYPRSIERISTTAADVKKFLKARHPDSKILWFESPAAASKRTKTLNKDYLLNRDGFEYLQDLLNEDKLGYCGARIAFFESETNYTGETYYYGFQVRNLH